VSPGRGKVDIIPVRQVQRSEGGRPVRNIRVRAIRVGRVVDSFGETLVTISLQTYDGEAHAVALEVPDALELRDAAFGTPGDQITEPAKPVFGPKGTES
jgi:hypothetical protein